MTVEVLSEDEFVTALRMLFLYYHDIENVGEEENLAERLDAPRLTLLLRFIETLRGREFHHTPDVGVLTLRNCYQLYLGGEEL